jgi:hypothetical protein
MRNGSRRPCLLHMGIMALWVIVPVGLLETELVVFGRFHPSARQP